MGGERVFQCFAAYSFSYHRSVYDEHAGERRPLVDDDRSQRYRREQFQRQQQQHYWLQQQQRQQTQYRQYPDYGVGFFESKCFKSRDAFI
ncbi:hypothetical protein CAEBREN_29514 [Caenorhabditis brenneri]|uniref:Uncharacterized protein n=1 Tax=Caenorhabditis brenneri TaxID=135651 RepID=G0P981_CAEBE|nr:hypothetical protein CAEBREN_29514 [Caenorhabditis brenneri]